MGEEVFDRGMDPGRGGVPGFRLAVLAETHIVPSEWNVMLLIWLDRSTLAQTRA